MTSDTEGKTQFLLITPGAVVGDQPDNPIQRGWSDVALKPTGRRKVAQAAERLANYCRLAGINLASVVWAASPLRRASDTLEALGEGLISCGATAIDLARVRRHDDLKGIGAGRYTGWLLSEMLRDDATMAALRRDVLRAYPSSREYAGECFVDVSARLWRCLEVHYLRPGIETVGLVVDEEIVRALLAIARFDRLDGRALDRGLIVPRLAKGVHLEVTHGSRSVRVVRNVI